MNWLMSIKSHFIVQLWDNLHSAFGDQPDLVELADKLSENFQTLCAEKVSKSPSLPSKIRVYFEILIIRNDKQVHLIYYRNFTC